MIVFVDIEASCHVLIFIIVLGLSEIIELTFFCSGVFLPLYFTMYFTIILCNYAYRIIENNTHVRKYLSDFYFLSKKRVVM